MEILGRLIDRFVNLTYISLSIYFHIVLLSVNSTVSSRSERIQILFLNSIATRWITRMKILNKYSTKLLRSYGENNVIFLNNEMTAALYRQEID